VSVGVRVKVAEGVLDGIGVSVGFFGFRVVGMGVQVGGREVGRDVSVEVGGMGVSLAGTDVAEGRIGVSLAGKRVWVA
jgi:hypothetical protein